MFSLRRDVASRRVWLCETGRDVLCKFDYWSLAVRKTVSMPPTKVCSVKKTCDHVFRSKAECNLQEKAMKRMRAVESESVKSARKAKDKLHKPFKEHQKLVSELYTGRNKTMHMASMRESRDSDRFLCSQRTSTITCTVVPRVWHFSAFQFE